MITYITIAVAFLMTLVGIVGSTWDKRRKGLRRLTATGWAVFILATLACLIGFLEARRKDEEMRDIEAIRSVAYHRVTHSVSYLLRHLMPEYNSRFLDNQQVLSSIREPGNLARLSGTRLLGTAGTVMDGFGGVGGEFEHPWQLMSFNIDHGRRMLDDVAVKYGAFVKPDLLLKISDVVDDHFFVSQFQLQTAKGWIDMAPHEPESPWGMLGTYYFKGIAIPGKNTGPDYGPFLSWLSKVERLVSCVDDKGKLRIFADVAATPRKDK